MSDILAERMANYGFETSAQALFLHSAKDSKGLQVLLPDKGMEFSDGSYGGAGAFKLTRRLDYSSILCYFDIVKIPPVFSSTATRTSKKPWVQSDTSRIPL